MKTFRFFLTSIFLLCCSVMQAQEIDGINYSLNSSEKTAEVRSSSNQYSGDIIIPETVEYNGVTYNVTSIGSQAFYYCSSLTSIDLPDGITSIGSQAFYYCTSLTSIDLPDGITSIGNEAFYGCSSLDRIYLLGENPFTYNPNSCLFEYHRIIIVPESAIDTYCNAEGWSDNAKYITSAERMSHSIEVTASNSGSSVRNAIGDDKVAGVVDLKITGTINSYDIIVLNQKMPILHNLDLSEAQIVACDYPYYNNYCTADNQISDYLFYKHLSLRHIILPKDITGEMGGMFSHIAKLEI